MDENITQTVESIPEEASVTVLEAPEETELLSDETPVIPQEPEETEETPLDPRELNERELQAMKELSQRIDIGNAQHVQQYGCSAQLGLAQLGEDVLRNFCGRELGELGILMKELVAELKIFGTEEADGNLFSRLFCSKKRRLEILRGNYNTMAQFVDEVAEEMERYQLGLTKDGEILAQMYENNLSYYKMFSIYVRAGRIRLRRERETTLANMREIARRTMLPQDAQSAKRFENLCFRFERKLYDLERTGEDSLQIDSQIQVAQKNNALVSDKMQECLLRTIPFWKEQITQLLGIVQKAADDEKQTVVDVKTLKIINAQLMATLNEILQTYTDGKQENKTAEAELLTIQDRLKLKLEDQRNAD